MSYRMLVCDDEPHITRSISMKFTRAGHRVVMCADGQAAWDEFLRHQPDLLITDCQMPRLDGLQLCARLRSEPAFCDTPIIMLTAKGYDLDEEELRRELGIARVVVKPFSLRELLILSESLLSTAGQPT